MANGKRKQSVTVCDICGTEGYNEDLVICNICKNNYRHRYCMGDVRLEVPILWHCEGCLQYDAQSSSSGSNQEPNKRLSFVDTHPSSSEHAKVKKLAKCEKNKNTQKMKNSDTTFPLQKFEQLLPQPKQSEQNLVNCHAPQACWNGIFQIFDEGLPLPAYEGIRAHVSCGVNPKVVDLCKDFPKRLDFIELAISKVWPRIFMLEPPNKEDVGFYFFSESRRSRDKYISLVKRLDERDHALKARIKGARLLIFSSKYMPDSERMKNEPYLWGIIQSPKPKAKANSDNTKAALVCDQATEEKKSIKSSMSKSRGINLASTSEGKRKLLNGKKDRVWKEESETSVLPEDVRNAFDDPKGADGDSATSSRNHGSHVPVNEVECKGKKRRSYVSDFYGSPSLFNISASSSKAKSSKK